MSYKNQEEFFTYSRYFYGLTSFLLRGTLKVNTDSRSAKLSRVIRYNAPLIIYVPFFDVVVH
jgi:hypothetical protein